MVKPDTPKFAVDTLVEIADYLISGLMDVSRGKRVTDLDERGCAYNAAVKAIAAAPKPDCVGTDELKRQVHEKCPKGFYATISEVIDYLNAQGFLAVKEKV